MFKLNSFLFFFIGCFAFAQVSSDCTAAIAICYNTPINGGAIGIGLDDYNGAASSGCLEPTISGTIESNSAWYRFRTNASGQLGINIGHDALEDWDFALYQTTDCVSLGEPVRCNFFDNSDENTFIGIGEDPNGNGANVQYEEWLEVEPGQDYYLLINNFSDVNSGFSIQFTGDIFVSNPNDALDCTIVSNLLGAPITACENETITLDATTANAFNYIWYQDIGNGFEEILSENSEILEPTTSGLYRVRVLTPTENIISDVQVAFSPLPVAQTVEDELICYSELGYDLGQKDLEALGSQNPQEFLVGYFTSQQDAEQGSSELPKQYLKNVGVETIFVRVTSIQNPNCYDASVSFDIEAFIPPNLGVDQEIFICDNISSILIGEDTTQPDYLYEWNTGEVTSSIEVSGAGTYILTATINYGTLFCVRTRTFTVVESVTPIISDVQIGDFSFSNTIRIFTEVEGDFEYSLDEGAFQDSPIFEEVLPGNYMVYMRDKSGCGIDSAPIAVVGCPAYFSPNGDDINEEWHVLGINYLNEPIVTIYDRYGKLIRELTPYDSGWDGTYNGTPLSGTDYWFKLTFLDDNANRVVAKFLQNHFSLRR